MKGMDQCTFVSTTKLINFITFKLIYFINVQNNDILLEKKSQFLFLLVLSLSLSFQQNLSVIHSYPWVQRVQKLMLMKVLFWKNLSIFLTISTGLIQSSCPCVSDTSPWSITMRKANCALLCWTGISQHPSST